MIEIIGVQGLPEIVAGTDLAALIAQHAELRDGDVVVVSQKIVSKSEDCLVDPLPGEDREVARRRIARAIAVRVLADSSRALVVETPQGLVCANAGIDASNIPGGRLALLPDDPDASAQRLRDGLALVAGVAVAVVISDTFGRPWRIGQTDVAIGVAGIAPIRDERGGIDREGEMLDVTQIAVVDELAGAADLVRRKSDGIPVVVVRGFQAEADTAGSARDLVRPSEEDLFPRGVGGLAEPLAQLGRSEPVWAAGVAPDDVRAVLSTLRALGRAVPGQATESAQGPTVFTAEGVLLGVLAGLLVDRGYTVRLRGPATPSLGTPSLAAGRPRRPQG